MSPDQPSLFADTPHRLPGGSVFVPEFLAREEEADLLDAIRVLPLEHAAYKQYTARRKVAAFGAGADEDGNAGRPLPVWLLALRARVAAWLAVPQERFTQMLVAEYAPGTPLGWHRDMPDFESIVGLSLGGSARMRFRPYPPPPGRGGPRLQLVLPPRSLYVIEGAARWHWQHAISETIALRHSITLRTARGAPLLRAA